MAIEKIKACPGGLRIVTVRPRPFVVVVPPGTAPAAVAPLVKRAVKAKMAAEAEAIAREAFETFPAGG